MTTSRLRLAWEALRSSLWFVPAVLVVAFVALAFGLVELDAVVGSEALSRYPRLFGAGAEGSRGMLEAVAAAMITVAGVTFSITIVALSLTSSQYSPRVLRNFMGDRSNQVVLGTFVGLYAYCLIVLRTIRGGESEFVPSIATFGAVVLAFVGIALLIHFIHHVSASMQAARILAAIHDETLRAIDRLYPALLGERREEPEPAWQATPRAGVIVPAPRSGYVQGVDADELLQCAVASNAVVRLECRIGDFVIEGCGLARVDGGTTTKESLERMARAVTIGDQRTLGQDAAFGLRQIVDVALKALSPGINDTTTAVMCLDRLSGLLTRLAVRRAPSPYRGADGMLRVVAPTYDFPELLTLALEEIRIAAAKQPIVLARLVCVLDGLLQAAGATQHQAAILAALSRVSETVQALDDAPQRRDLGAALAVVRSRASVSGKATAAGHAWRRS